MTEWQQHCKILGVSINASQNEIKKSYIDQAKLFHPDKHGNSAVAKNKFQQLQESYAYLIKHVKDKKPDFEESTPAKTRKNDKKKKSKSAGPKKIPVWVWIYGVVFALMITATAWIFRSQPSKVPQNPAAMTRQEIEEVLKDHRLYSYRMGSNASDCSKLQRDHGDYHELVSTRERFPNTNCGDVRAYISNFGKDSIVTVVAPSVEACRCQVAELKKKPKLNPNQSTFNNKDL